MLNAFLDNYSYLLDPNTSLLNFGPKIAPLNWFINFQKGGTVFFLLTLMIYFDNFSLGAWVYLALHGSYGVIWIIKDVIFPDPGFKFKAGPVVIATLIVVLLNYWSIGYLMMSGIANNNPSYERIFFCIFIYVIGLTLMMCTDLQKYITLKYKKGLISEHFLASNRNTNYFGEILLYCSFAILVDHRYAFYSLFFVWGTVFVSRIHLKEKSLKKKDGYEKYRRNSYLLLFKFYDQDIYNVLLYAGSTLLLALLYYIGGIEVLVKKIK